MASHVYVTLDTLAPTIEIFAPAYTTSQSIEDITIEANENLDPLHEIYFIDAMGERHDFIFSLEPSLNRLFGRVSFYTFASGQATLFVRVHDEVWNRSSLYKKIINVDVDTGQPPIEEPTTEAPKQAILYISEKVWDSEIKERTITSITLKENGKDKK
jgi:hypothetical protein